MANDAYVDVGVTIYAEAIIEDALRLSLSQYSSPPFRIDIPITNPLRLEERPSENFFSGGYNYDTEMYYLTPLTVVYEQFDDDHGEIEVEQLVETEKQPGQQQSETMIQQQLEFVEQPIQ
ncbi:hypothetical protein PanWU01x14_003900 [Parasponia andersonii]|uniref:Uncharacterized protein n=1 Tax=Parasponia andersonii TaxID=3476 RepID=A0A2P5E343_PARAD|nr:hypothetical protein PanWU01x14_003900 [Parasponia andersonii]